MTPVDLIEAVRGAVFQLLETAHAESDAAVLDYVGQNQPAPFVAIDELTWENEGSKAEPLLRVTVDVGTVYKGEDRAKLLGLMHINMVLHDGALTAPGAGIRAEGIAGGGASGIAADGLTYWGTQTFDFYVEAA